MSARRAIGAAARTGLAVAATSGGLAMAQDTRDPAREPVACTIEEAVQGSGVTLHGRITGRVAASGRYSLRVRKTGAAGSSDIAQGGDFRVEPAGRTDVGRVSIGLEQGARYEAVLTLTMDGRTYTCDATGPGPRPL